MLIQLKTEGGSSYILQRQVPFNPCSSCSELNRSTPYHLLIRPAWRPYNGTIRCPGTRWTRFRSLEKTGCPVVSPTPTIRIWRVLVRGGYPADGTPGPSYICSWWSWYIVYRQWIQQTRVRGAYFAMILLTALHHTYVWPVTSRSMIICCIVHACCVLSGNRWSSTKSVLYQCGTGPKHEQVLKWQFEYSRECDTK